MPKSSILAKLLPILAVVGVIALSWVGASRLSIHPRLVACAGYGTGYGYTGVPSVTSVNPNEGPVAGGTTVTITGQGYCGGGPTTSVSFGGTAAASFTVNSDTSITAVSPAHAVGVVDVTVTTTAGTSAATAADQFTYGLTWYFNWYDLASAGTRADTIHITNVSGSTATGDIRIAGGSPIPFTVGNGNDAYFSFPYGTIGGPVTILSNQTIIATLRAWYYNSFNETPARPGSAAATVQYFPWYDLSSAGMNADTIHITNVSGATATGTIALSGATTINFSVGDGMDAYFTFPYGTIGGPVTITSNRAVLASLRAWYYQTFNETLGLPASAAAMVQYFPWYDKASAGVNADTIHITNESGVPATGTIAIAVTGVAPIPFTVATGTDAYFTFPQGTIGGPVTITSTAAVLASLRAWYYQSFNEVHGRPQTAARTLQYFPWYDKASAGVNADTIHITNESGVTATGTITLSGAATISFSVANGQDLYFTFPQGTIGGPVTITSNQAVLVSLRAWYYQSFNEVPGYF